jgi:hypothetical protein
MVVELEPLMFISESTDNEIQEILAIPDPQLDSTIRSGQSQSRRREQRRSEGRRCMTFPIPYSLDYHGCEHGWCKEAYSTVAGSERCCRS